MHASDSKMDTGGDRPVAGTRSESITTGYSVTVRGGKNLTALATFRRHQLEISSHFCTCDLLVNSDLHILSSFEVQVFGRSHIFESVTVHSEVRMQGMMECFCFSTALYR